MSMIPRASQESQTIAHEIVESMTHMATLPEVTLNIIDIVEDPTSSASDLHQIVATDPALSARIPLSTGCPDRSVPSIVRYPCWA
jgi:HD-like signal output (HDOD) protein